jgi:hypothetical protein
MDERCRAAPDDELLARARYNAARKYAVVGSTELMGASLALLARRLPAYFGGRAPGGALATGICNKCKANQTSPGGGPVISGANRAVLERLNAVDVKLYDFIMRFLRKRLRSCGIGDF